MRLDGKTCLITGAAGGIGMAMVAAFLAEGARVIATDRDLAAIETAAAALPAGMPGRLYPHALDVTDDAMISALNQRLEAAGLGPDVLVNNAAAIRIGKLLDTAPQDLDLVYSVNMRGLLQVTRGFLPGMIARGGGNVLNMASLAGVHAMHERFAYSASKAAIVMMTRAIAIDYVDDRIRSNCICPARVETPFVTGYLQRYYPDEVEERFQALAAYQPLGRMIRPDEVAAMAVFLASDESAMISGQSFVIDGGVTAGDQPGARIGARG
ncbi:SDR family NAD(P)-dependent oxidoreductase [Pseudogemmobacter sonorensis]|uniref:SDR family NAD(P)-dependent oxidoreductase n=1 Tax=Pseudogemmobacter sonorensis TaxID=2989681 RepID=UPI0036CCD345